MFSFGILLSATLAAVAHGAVVDCAASKSLFQIQSQAFTPDPPVPGENATLWIDYTVPAGLSVSAGTAKYSISYNGIPFSPTTEDLCTQVTCPLTAGTWNLSSTSVWPTGINGKVVTKIEWFDSANTLLLCSQTTERV